MTRPQFSIHKQFQHPQLKSGYCPVQTLDGPMQVYFSYPDAVDELKTIIVLQEAFGVNGHIKDICHRLNAAGYLALAPELFHRQGDFIQVDYQNRHSVMPLLAQIHNEDLHADIAATLSLVQEMPRANPGRVSTLGFCMGGFASVLAACSFELRAAVSFYGAGILAPRPGIGFGGIKPLLANLQAPVLLLFGEDDPSIPANERHALSAELHRHHKNFEMEVFPHSNHGFFCDQRKSYQAKAAEAAWSRTLDWLKQYS
jgi:carboxymethylenebutenolidase